MTLFELTLHVDHVDDDLVDTLIDQFDATTGRDHTGSDFITVLASGSTFDEAARTMLTRLQTMGIRVRRAVPDLLSKSDIADRLGVTRQAVQNWVSGARQGNFPRAVNPVSGGVWLWHDVNAWAVANERAVDHGIAYPTIGQLDTINAWIESCKTPSWRRATAVSPAPAVRTTVAMARAQVQAHCWAGAR